MSGWPHFPKSDDIKRLKEQEAWPSFDDTAKVKKGKGAKPPKEKAWPGQYYDADYLASKRQKGRRQEPAPDYAKVDKAALRAAKDEAKWAAQQQKDIAKAAKQQARWAKQQAAAEKEAINWQRQAEQEAKKAGQYQQYNTPVYYVDDGGNSGGDSGCALPGCTFVFIPGWLVLAILIVILVVGVLDNAGV